MPVPDSRRVDGCCRRHSRVLLPRLGEDVPRDVGGVHSDGAADARIAAAASALAGRSRFYRHRHRELHGDHFDGVDFRQEAKLRSPSEPGAAGDGTQQYRRRNVLVRSERHLAFQITSAGSDGGQDAGRVHRFRWPNPRHPPLDRTSVSSLAKSKSLIACLPFSSV